MMMHQNPKQKGGGNQDTHGDMLREEGNTKQAKEKWESSNKKEPANLSKCS
jgi:hypothetical protein